MSIHLMITDDPDNIDLLKNIKSKLSESRNFLYLCAARNIKDVRLANPTLSEQLKSENPDKTNTYTFLEFMEIVKRKTFNDFKSITRIDQQFILTRIIQKMFGSDKLKLNVFYQMRYQIFELYDFLIFSNKSISEEVISSIGKDFSWFEEDLFKIYSTFCTVLNKISNKNYDSQIKTFLGRDFKITSEKCLPLNENIKNVINDKLQTVNMLFYDSFLFINDMQKYVIDSALELEKEVFLIVEEDGKEAFDNNFLENLHTKFPQLRTNSHLTKIFKKSISMPNTALNLVKTTYPSVISNSNIKYLFQDNSIKVLPPFINRDEEFMFIAKSISEDLKETCGEDVDKLKARINDKIAVIISMTGYDEKLQRALDQVGVFVFKDKTAISNLNFEKKIKNNFKHVYFKKETFLNEKICFEDGEVLNFKDKLKFFDLCFEGITINRMRFSRKPAAYPISQFIFKIYNIFLNGIDIESFKIILYANWYNRHLDLEAKWDTYLTEFKYLEPFLNGFENIDSWIERIKYLQDIKGKIDSDSLMEYHPLKFIKTQSFDFFIDVLNFINKLIKAIETTIGGISEHIKVLKHNILNIYKLDFKSDFQAEKQIIDNIIESVEKINTNSIVTNIDAKYFAESLSSLLKEFENDLATDNTTKLNLNVVTRENVKHYDICYLPMCEANKYPKPYSNNFPFSKEILSVLSSNKYGINSVPANFKTLDYHLELEKYLFKNVLDFTNEQLIITRTFKENDRELEFSPFVEDIYTIFDKEIDFEDSYLKNEEKQNLQQINPLKKLKFEDKKRYSLNELATFKLCPKLYFHIQKSNNSIPYLSKYQLQFYFTAVVYSKFLSEFRSFNRQNKNVYSVHNDECFCESTKIISRVFYDTQKYFPIFTDYEINDLKINLVGKVAAFLESIICHNIKGSLFTVQNIDEKIIACKNHELLLQYDTNVLDLEHEKSYISQSNIYLDYLVLKTEDEKGKPLKRYADMIRRLDENLIGCDRINLVSQIIRKINIQLDIPKYKNDGIARINQLITDLQNFDFSSKISMPSKFCTYCRLNQICKDRRENQ